MKENIKRIILFLLVLIICIIGILASDTYSSFFNQIMGGSKTEVAEPIFILEHTEKQVVDDANNEINYYFSVKNYNEIKTSDVNLKYNIEITPIQDKAIILTLYKNNEIVSLNEQKTELLNLNHSNKEKHEYKLNVKYDKSNLDNCYDIASNISIRANAMQD